VTPAGVVVETGRVSIEECCHCRILATGSSIAHPL
jgi:hypothetical protein